MKKDIKSFQYQIDGVAQIEKFQGRALLADEQGLGKSRQLLMYIKNHPELRPVVIVCPAHLKEHWKHQCWLHIGKRAEILEGMTPPKYYRPSSQIIIINYDIITTKGKRTGKPAGWIKVLKRLKIKLLGIDECHYLGSIKTKRSRAVKKLSIGIPAIIAMSGTPFVNRPIELFPILNIIRPDIWKSFQRFAFAHCLPEDAPILMSDLREKKISEINIGDRVIGWGKPNGKGRQRRLMYSKVLDIIIKKSKLQKVTLTDGTEMICTPDHKWHDGGSSEHGKYTIAKTGRMGGRGLGSASRVMKIMREPTPSYDPESTDYALGYIHGFFRGDGYCSRQRLTRTSPFKNKTIKLKYAYHVGCACEDKSAMERVSKYLSKFGIKHSMKLRGDCLFQINIPRREGYRFISKKSSCRNSNEWWAGFLGGIYDSEGSGCGISQKKVVNPITYKMIISALVRFDFEIKHDDTINIRYNGGKKELLRFWKIANPAIRRKLIKMIMSNGGRLGGGVSESNSSYASTSVPFVKKIEKLPGIHKVYTLTTETGNYVAYGCGSKNCSPQRRAWGWVFNGAVRLKQLRRKLYKYLMIRRRKKDLLNLPDNIKTVVPLAIRNKEDYDHALNDFIKWLKKLDPGKVSKAEKAQKLVQMGYLKRLAARLKLPKVFIWIDEYISENPGKVIIFAIHRKIIERLQERYKNISMVVDGRIRGKFRQLAFEKFKRNPKCRLAIVQLRAAGTGWSSKAPTTVAVELDWVSGTHAQGDARNHGIGRGTKGVTSKNYYLVAKNTIEETLCKIIQTKQEVHDKAIDGDSIKNEMSIHDQLINEILNQDEKKRRFKNG